MTEFLGHGIYDRRDASRLTGASPQLVTRWLRGYRGTAGKAYPPLWRPEFQQAEELTLSFRDLMELHSVWTFRKAGLSGQLLRKAMRRASEIIGVERPFSTSRFKTDGVSIMLELEPVEGEPRMIDIFSSQYQMRQVIEQSLRNVEFDGNQPSLWRPLGRTGGVVIDPRRAFGQPIEEETGIPTQTLAEAVTVEGGEREAARLFEIPPRAVARALSYERRLQEAA